MVASSVHQNRDLLEQVYAMLYGYGYTVWMSDKGTMPVHPGRTNTENCLRAVDDCDLFLGLITGFYGSSKSEGPKSITHLEIERAIAKGKPRWFLVQHDVEICRQILKQYRFRGSRNNRQFRFEKTPILDDIRVLEMYECVKKGVQQWIQPYVTAADATRYVAAQFADQDRARQWLMRTPEEERR